MATREEEVLEAATLSLGWTRFFITGSLQNQRGDGDNEQILRVHILMSFQIKK